MIEERSVCYEYLIPSEFTKRLKEAPVAYLPLGTLEWHGTHMPLGADGLQSRGFFIRLASQAGGIVLPMLYQGPDTETKTAEGSLYGMDVCGENFTGNMRYENQKLPGSVYHISDDLFLGILDTLCHQLSRMGFRIIVAHGHGPSINLFRSAIPEFENKYNIRCLHCWGDFRNPDEIFYGLQVDHGGSNETSIMMAVEESLVKMEHLPTSMEEWPLGIGMGDPRLYASKEFGEEIITRQLDRMGKIIREELDRI